MAIKFGRPIESKTRFVPVEAAQSTPLDLSHRPRRLRRTAWIRRMVQENVLTTADLIWPFFLTEGTAQRVPISSMPGIDRLSVEEAVREAVRAKTLGIPCIA